MTGQAEYISGKDVVTFTATNNGNDDAYVACDYPMQAYTNPQGGQQNGVAQEQINSCYVLRGLPGGSILVAYKLAPGDTRQWNWNQKDFGGAQVADGIYVGKISTDENTNTLTPAKTFQTSNFNIEKDSDGDGVVDSQDVCPNDSKNQCNVGGGNGGTIITPTCSALANNNPLGDFDKDGVFNYNDQCPCLSGSASSKTGAGCPDADVKREARTWATEVIAGEAVATVVAGIAIASIAIGGAPLSGGASLILLAAISGTAAEETITEIYITASAAQQIAHDPPDLNYKQIVNLKPVKFIVYDDSQNKDIGITNRIISSGADIAVQADAFTHANERYMGAQQASDYYWMHVHAKEVRRYANGFAQSITNFNSATSDLEKLLSKSKLNMIVAKKDLINFQNKLRKQGVVALPQFERDLVRNLGGNDTNLKILSDRILSIDPKTWKDESVNMKLAKVRASSQKMAESLLSYSADLGSNIVLGKFILAQQNKYVKILPINIVNTPSVAHTIMVDIKYDAKNYKYSGVERFINLPDTKISVIENSPGQITIIIRSEKGIPYGTSGPLLDLTFATRGWLGKLSVMAPWLRPSPTPVITGLSGDAQDWLYSDKLNVRLPELTASVSYNNQTPIKLNLSQIY